MQDRPDITIHHYRNALNEACKYLSQYLTQELGENISKQQIVQLLLEDQGIRFYNKLGGENESRNFKTSNRRRLDVGEDMYTQYSR